MRYFANPCGSDAVVAAMESGEIGLIDTPGQGQGPSGDVRWCADNGAFGKRFDLDAWWSWLQRRSDHAGTCEFATAPDVVGDAAATLERSLPWLPKIRALGYPVAFVAQDGIEHTEVPWSSFDVLFIGGTTTFKLGPMAMRYAKLAKDHGKRVHVGRVNSRKRFQYAQAAWPLGLGADTADGTFLTYAPDHNLERMRKWLEPDRMATMYPHLWEDV